MSISYQGVSVGTPMNVASPGIFASAESMAAAVRISGALPKLARTDPTRRVAPGVRGCRRP
jgi:hypothetical protein